MTTLAMPKNYVEINSEEMTYIGGGLRIAEDKFALWANATIIVTCFLFTGGATVGKLVTKFGWSKVKKVIKRELVKKGVTSAGATTVCDLLDLYMSWSAGKAIAYLCDKYDSTGDDGWVVF